MTALKLGGLVLKEEQKAALYAVTLKSKIVYVFYRRVLECPLFFNSFLKSFCCGPP